MPPRRRGTAVRPRAAATPSQPSGPQRPQAIVNLQDAQRPGFKKWWFYGGTGVGKTVLAGTAPKNLFLTTDVEGTTSAKEMGSTADELPIRTWREFVEAVDWIVHSGHKEFEWITLDTVDELEEICWLAQLDDTEIKRASKYQPSKGDYPVVWRKVKAEIMRLNRCGVNVMYLSHDMRVDRESEDGEDTITLAMPMVGSTKRGDLSTYLCAQMTLVGYYRAAHSEDGTEVRQLLTKTTNRFVAKDRHNTFGAGINNPTVPKMLERIASKGTPTTARRARRATR
jgi:hypothetical protein